MNHEKFEQETFLYLSNQDVANLLKQQIEVILRNYLNIKEEFGVINNFNFVIDSSMIYIDCYHFTGVESFSFRIKELTHQNAVVHEILYL